MKSFRWGRNCERGHRKEKKSGKGRERNVVVVTEGTIDKKKKGIPHDVDPTTLFLD